MLPGFLAILDCWKELPAAVSAATPAAITAVTVPASAPAATATPASPSSAPAKAATATAASRSSSTATATLTRGPGFVDDNIAAHEIMAIQSLDGALGFLVAIDFDKSEPARLP